MNKIKRLPVWGVYGLLAYMPFHIFLSQSLSLLTGGLDVWKVAKDFVTIFLLVFAIVFALYNQKLRDNKIFRITLILAIVYGLLHFLTYIFSKQTSLSVAMLASTYNNRLFWYFLIAFVGVRLVKDKNIDVRVIKLILAVSTLVCLLGLLQWFLPKDILTHLGYNIERGVKPNFFINDDINYPRIMSTIRDPNSLGAFLILPTLLLASLYGKVKKEKKQLIRGLLLLHALILLLTFSRAAWLGIIISGLTLLIISNKKKASFLLKQYWMILVGLIILFGVGLYSQRQSYFVRSVVFRIDDKNKATDPDSDQLHVYFIEKGVNGVMQKPMGYGPGTAGIVSIQNENGGTLTENYYIQIAHEVGVFGLLIFVMAWVYVIKLLVQAKSVLGTVLVASACAYAVMAIVMHLWSNEAVAAQWWLLAGVVVGLKERVSKKE
ncbi:MAG: O-antigen ligase family protein [Candidatus Saccharibacteria bacterium]